MRESIIRVGVIAASALLGSGRISEFLSPEPTPDGDKTPINDGKGPVDIPGTPGSGDDEDGFFGSPYIGMRDDDDYLVSCRRVSPDGTLGEEVDVSFCEDEFGVVSAGFYDK